VRYYGADHILIEKKGSPQFVKWIEDTFEVIEPAGANDTWMLKGPKKGGASAKPAPKGKTPEQIAALTELLSKRPNDFIESIKKQLEAGRNLSEKQLKAVRQNLYRSRMKEEADLFRAASAKRVAARYLQSRKA
jgi:uncharacterized membrane protein